jgi:short-subunit dehydrogenase
MDVANKVFVITGGGNGIGREVVLGLVARGARVAAVDLSQAAYGARKAAVKLFTEALYAESMGTNLAVSGVFPGGVGTNITANSGVEMPVTQDAEPGKGSTVTSAEDAGKQIIEGLEKGAFRVLVGGDAKFMERYARLSPRRATKLIANKMKDLRG